jgi:transposase
MAGKTKNYREEFKKQIVALKQNGKSIADISKEYEIAKSTIISQANNTERIDALEQTNKLIDQNIETLEKLIDEEDLIAHKNIENKYANENINAIHQQIINKSIENIKECGFENNNFRNNIINFEEYKK